MKQIKLYILFLIIFLGFTACADNKTNENISSENGTYTSENSVENKSLELPNEDESNQESTEEEQQKISVSNNFEQEKNDGEIVKTDEISDKNEDFDKTADEEIVTNKSENDKNTEIADDEKTSANTDENVCTILIDSSTILNNLDKFDSAKKDILPSDGIILDRLEVEFQDGDTAFDILQKTTRDKKIHMEFSTTPGYNTKYVEGIGNIYEFDCGELSGWLYKVNGEFPGYSSSEYVLSPNDEVEWLYTCDMGRDVGSTGGLDEQ